MNDNQAKLSAEQTEFLRQKEYVLERGNRVGYAPIPHSLYQQTLPMLAEKYGKADARDAVFLYTYLHAYMNGSSDKAYYLWAFPSVADIADVTGIAKDRMKPLIDVLIAEGLMRTKYVWFNGNRKKMFMPLYEPLIKRNSV